MDVRAAVTADGALPYLLAQPLRPTLPRGPLIVFLHGAGESLCAWPPFAPETAWSTVRGYDPSDRTWRETQVRLTPIGLAVDSAPLVENCVVLAPASARSWSSQRAQVLALIDEVIARTPFVDPDRVILTGLSMGGQGAFELGCAGIERFAGVSPICGTVTKKADVCRSLSNVPLWIAHGLHDSVVPLEHSGVSEAVTALRAAGNSRVVYHVFPATHDSWSATYSDAAWWGWARARRRGSPPETDTIRISYCSTWSPAILVYSADRGPWAARLPGPAGTGSTGTGSAALLAAIPERPGWQAVAVRASILEFGATDGRGKWDNPPGGGNYAVVEPGEYEWNAGVLTRVA